MSDLPIPPASTHTERNVRNRRARDLDSRVSDPCLLPSYLASATDMRVDPAGFAYLNTPAGNLHVPRVLLERHHERNRTPPPLYQEVIPGAIVSDVPVHRVENHDDDAERQHHQELRNAAFADRNMRIRVLLAERRRQERHIASRTVARPPALRSPSLPASSALPRLTPASASRARPSTSTLPPNPVLVNAHRQRHREQSNATVSRSRSRSVPPARPPKMSLEGVRDQVHHPRPSTSRRVPDPPARPPKPAEMQSSTLHTSSTTRGLSIPPARPPKPISETTTRSGRIPRIGSSSGYVSIDAPLFRTSGKPQRRSIPAKPSRPRQEERSQLEGSSSSRATLDSEAGLRSTDLGISGSSIAPIGRVVGGPSDGVLIRPPKKPRGPRGLEARSLPASAPSLTFSPQRSTPTQETALRNHTDSSLGCPDERLTITTPISDSRRRHSESVSLLLLPTVSHSMLSEIHRQENIAFSSDRSSSSLTSSSHRTRARETLSNLRSFHLTPRHGEGRRRSGIEDHRRAVMVGEAVHRYRRQVQNLESPHSPHRLDCPICPGFFYGFENLQRHLARVHSRHGNDLNSYFT